MNINNYPIYKDKKAAASKSSNNLDNDSNDNNNQINNQNIKIVKTHPDKLTDKNKNIYVRNSHKNKIPNNITENENSNSNIKLNLSTSKKITSTKYINNKKNIFDDDENEGSLEIVRKSIGTNASFSNKYSVKHLCEDKKNIYENNSNNINKKLNFFNESPGDRKYSSKSNKTNEIKDRNTITEKELVTVRKNKTKTIRNKERVKKIVINREKCTNCQCKYSFNSKYKPLFNVCYKCLEDKIESQIYVNYLEYISNMLNNGYINYELIKKNFESFLAENINIFKKDITIEECLKELNKYCLEKNKDKKNYAVNTAILKIKKKICLVCLKEIEENPKNLKIFCGCCFCSKKHLKFYFDEVNDILPDSNFVCLCGYVYDKIAIYDLGVTFSKLGIWSLRDKIVENFKNMLKTKCCICEGNNQLIIIDYYIDDETAGRLNILGGCKELKHYLCKECKEKYKSKSKGISFECCFCNRVHTYNIERKI